ncbi:zinc finger CCCH domain-containing protein 43-like [Brachypodium distachyon]|uniref:zinc finger CCCH domain-containing protein 43-like n=1 Tax=Brachypodium distachyon TaxID=15368 RepID=UPI000D0D983E|nr:zinc finger CCCH domain-containing protein 43-like [Brachypodium distachyon]|eukprot:XP_024312792.1 zinc finger CCCH domain-containing protein 43-like [Brachypodium distachyon]
MALINQLTKTILDQRGVVCRPSSPWKHLNNVAYEEIAQRFKDKTGIELKKKQIKNKWDKLKNEYGIWKRLLLKQTGAGWERGTINQDAEWWRKAKVDIPGCGRFQNQGIRNEDNLELIFEDITNDGHDHWCPTSGDLPQPNIVEDVIYLDGEDGIDIDELDESPSNVKGKKRGAKVVGDKSKKSKTSQVMQDEMKKIGALAEKTQSSLESFTTKNDACSVATVMDLVIECGGAYSTNEHFIATELFVKREQREMFLHMPTPDIRFEWLKRKYEAKYAR